MHVIVSELIFILPYLLPLPLLVFLTPLPPSTFLVPSRQQSREGSDGEGHWPTQELSEEETLQVSREVCLSLRVCVCVCVCACVCVCLSLSLLMPFTAHELWNDFRLCGSTRLPFSFTALYTSVSSHILFKSIGLL